MVNHGFQLTGDHGIFQIDGTHQNICLADVFSVQGTGGVVYDSADVDSGRITKLPLIFVNTSTIIAIDCDNWAQISADSMIQPIHAEKVNAKIYAFSDKPNNWYKSNMGLSIRNDQNIEVYNSNWAIMKIVDVFNISYVESWSYKIPAGKKYAFVVLSGNVEVSIRNHDGEVYNHFYRRVGNLFEINFMAYSKFISYASRMHHVIKTPISIIVIDVADL
ncbi:hypothetical protein [Photorhabdus asymbiotica]|uniref:hypothetical protein n=1 Tax=Photorhabdus asymbiotica TaxID=291112 RepID=UPI003DA72E0D